VSGTLYKFIRFAFVFGTTPKGLHLLDRLLCLFGDNRIKRRKMLSLLNIYRKNYINNDLYLNSKGRNQCIRVGRPKKQAVNDISLCFEVSESEQSDSGSDGYDY